MYRCTVCDEVWAARLAACPGRGCGGALRAIGPADSDHAVLRRFPLARFRGATTATVAPVATVAAGDGAEATDVLAATVATGSPKAAARPRGPRTGSRARSRGPRPGTGR